MQNILIQDGLRIESVLNLAHSFGDVEGVEAILESKKEFIELAEDTPSLSLEGMESISKVVSLLFDVALSKEEEKRSFI